MFRWCCFFPPNCPDNPAIPFYQAASPQMKNFIIPQGKKLLFPFQDVVLIRNLTKVFGGGGWKTKKRLRRLFRRGKKEEEEVGSGGKVAVDNISVGIRRGEVKKCYF